MTTLRKDYKAGVQGIGISNLREYYRLLKSVARIPPELDRELVRSFVQLEHAAKIGDYNRIIPLYAEHCKAVIAIRQAIADKLIA
jgi:hypothetical protein